MTAPKLAIVAMALTLGACATGSSGKLAQTEPAYTATSTLDPKSFVTCWLGDQPELYNPMPVDGGYRIVPAQISLGVVPFMIDARENAKGGSDVTVYANSLRTPRKRVDLCASK